MLAAYTERNYRSRINNNTARPTTTRLNTKKYGLQTKTLSFLYFIVNPIAAPQIKNKLFVYKLNPQNKIRGTFCYKKYNPEG